MSFEEKIDSFDSLEQSAQKSNFESRGKYEAVLDE